MATFIAELKTTKLEQIIKDDNLKIPAAHIYMEQAFNDGHLQVTGTALTRPTGTQHVLAK